MGTRRGSVVPAQTTIVTKVIPQGAVSAIECVNDDLVLVILDFVDVKQVLRTVATSCKRMRLIAR